MSFDSFTFVVFAFTLLGIHRSALGWNAKKAALLVGSYVFYAGWRAPYLVLIAVSTVVDWFVARRLAGAEAPSRRRLLLILSLTANLGLLGVFKYVDFLLGSLAAFGGSVGLDWRLPTLGLTLPVGISFYTFQTLSYTIDVYRRSLRPSRSFLDYSLYVAFFPQLVAGPIVRARDFLPQCRSETRASTADLGWGGFLFLLGLWQKKVLADGLLAPVVERVYDSVRIPDPATAWLGTLAFAGQIFCDFSGYSSCAIGIGRCFGFRLPINFRQPYAAVGFSDFWRRWHISLSTWLRDYLYISLGGNRVPAARHVANVMITMLLGGLWHGASWNFVIWGGLHGCYLIGERSARRITQRLGSNARRALMPGAWAATFGATCFAWVFFRAEDLERSGVLVRALLGGGDGVGFFPPDSIHRWNVGVASLVMVGLLGAHWHLRNTDFEAKVGQWPWMLRGAVAAALALSLLLMAGEERAFIYFQF